MMNSRDRRIRGDGDRNHAGCRLAVYTGDGVTATMIGG
jgi:hypothetical protein